MAWERGGIQRQVQMCHRERETRRAGWGGVEGAREEAVGLCKLCSARWINKKHKLIPSRRAVGMSGGPAAANTAVLWNFNASGCLQRCLVLCLWGGWVVVVGCFPHVSSNWGKCVGERSWACPTFKALSAVMQLTWQLGTRNTLLLPFQFIWRSHITQIFTSLLSILDSSGAPGH